MFPIELDLIDNFINKNKLNQYKPISVDSDYSSLIINIFDNNLNNIKNLLDANIDINQNTFTRYNLSPLLLASMLGHTNIVKLFLDNKACSTYTCNKNWSPIVVASINGYTEIVQLLIQYNLDLKYDLALLCAIEKGFEQLVEILINAGANVNYSKLQGNLLGCCSPLYHAIYYKNINIINMLIKSGSNINYDGPNNSSSINDAVYVENFEIIKLIIDCKGDINRQVFESGYYSTALSIACEKNNIEIVDYLLCNNAYITEPVINSCVSDEIMKLLFCYPNNLLEKTINDCWNFDLSEYIRAGQFILKYIDDEKEIVINNCYNFIKVRELGKIVYEYMYSSKIQVIEMFN
jgi:ankyrin repeat protein